MVDGYIWTIIKENGYEGIRDQDGVETLEFTVRENHDREIANIILSVLEVHLDFEQQV